MDIPDIITGIAIAFLIAVGITVVVFQMWDNR